MIELETIDDRMNTAPPRGFRVVGRQERLQDGDYIMTGNRPGDWRLVHPGTGLLGRTAAELADLAAAEVKLAREVGR